ncbi:hypothetical protein V1264_011222 [Littorina saxatilis]|uniref:Uncharacterized protein n=1 Tax=Littorina saxatilis TaxID=31220 RepID=A0AAN9GK02_9CAEN
MPPRASKNIPKPRPVALKTLKQLIKNGKVVRTGATKNPERRYSEYSRDKKYRGCWMLYARTINQMRGEDRLLKLNRGQLRLNIHRRSTAPQAPGYLYGMVKRKISKK